MYEQYNANMRAKHGEDPSTYLEYDSELWFKAGVIGRPNRNQVYSISIATAWDMRLDDKYLKIYFY
jgi:hypothetical protein